MKHSFLIFILLSVYIILLGFQNDFITPGYLFKKDSCSSFSYLHGILWEDIRLEKGSYEFNGSQLNNFEMYENGKSGPGQSYIQSALWAPFYFIAHVVSKTFNYPDNGVSLPYNLFLLSGSVFYLITSILLIGCILTSLSFKPLEVFFTTLLIGFMPSTIAFLSDPFTPNLATFFLVALYVYSTIKWHESRKSVHLMLTGVGIFSLLLISLLNLPALIFFVTYGTHNFSEAGNKVIPVRSFILMCFLIFILILPQFIFNYRIFGNISGAPHWPLLKLVILPDLVRSFNYITALEVLIFYILPISLCYRYLRRNEMALIFSNFLLSPLLMIGSYLLFTQKQDSLSGILAVVIPFTCIFIALTIGLIFKKLKFI